jgi:regulator of protease activity HflC (stomatin/prohibitin superfamily)
MNGEDLVGALCGGAVVVAMFGFPVAWTFFLRGFFIVEPGVAHVLLYWGKYSRTITEPGLKWVFPLGLDRRPIRTRESILQIPLTTVVEKHGNPIHVSAVAIYRVANPARALIDVHGYQRFVQNQASAILKSVCALYPYESRDHREPCLKDESREIIDALRTNLQKHVDSAGIEVVLVRLNDLTYAPEIAQSMLLRQQAQAMVDARRTLVEGAVHTVSDALDRMQRAELHLTPATQMRLATSLTLLLCAGDRNEHHGQTVVRRQGSTPH